MDERLMATIPGLSGGAPTASVPGMMAPQPGPQMGPNAFNIGNVRPVGSSTGFQQPASFDDGVAMSVRNVRAYPTAFNQGQPMTLLQIGQRWAPKGDGANDPAQWAKNVASIGGLPVDQPLDLNDPQIAARFARGVHGAEWGQKMLKPPEAYLPGTNMAGSPRVIRAADPSISANPQVTPTQMPGTVQPPRVDPMQYAPLTMSKRLGGYGRAMIDIGNQETQRYLADQEREQKRAQFEQEQRIREQNAAREERNARVGANGPNKALTEAEAQSAAAKAEAEAKVKLENDASLKLTDAEMQRYSKEVRPGVEASANSLPNLYEMKRLTSGNMAAGTLIDARMLGARALDTLGIQPMPDGMVNTTEYLNRASKNVLSFLQTRALGSGSGISEGDRKFVEQMGGKDASYTKEELGRLTDIAIQSAQSDLKKHDATVGRLKGLPGVSKVGDDYWKVNAPTYDEWAKANPAAGTKVTQMGSTYTPSLDPTSIMQNIAQPKDKAAYDALPPGTPYLHPDGTFKMKPKGARR